MLQKKKKTLQVGEENQKILYKNYMESGEIKDGLLTKIWLTNLDVYPPQWLLSFQNILAWREKCPFRQKKGTGVWFTQQTQEFQGSLVVRETLEKSSILIELHCSLYKLQNRSRGYLVLNSLRSATKWCVLTLAHASLLI